MLKRINIGNKLALIMIALSLTVIALLSMLFYVQFDTALKERVLLQLSSVKQLKIVQIKAELTDRLYAFQDAAKNLDDVMAEPGEVFSHIQLYDTIPSKINGLVLGITEADLLPEITMADVTPTDINQEITIALVTRFGDQYLIALAEVPEVQDILLERTGLGQTGESYIVGNDFNLRTKSRFYTQNPRTVQVKTKGVERALNDEPGEDLFPDYRGMEVFSSYEKIELNGITWVILSEINHQEALFPLKKLRSNLIYILILVIIFLFAASYFLSRMIVRPIVNMEKHLMDMSKGILDDVPASENRKDEIGRMFSALERLVSALQETVVFAGEIGSGNFNAQYKPLSEDDKMGTALIQMKEKLREFKENEERLLKENQRSILNGEEKERSRLSREMHDGLGPLLTTLRMNIQAADLNEKTKKELLLRLDETIGEVRRMSNNLMPNVLVDFGAGEAIGNLLKQINENFPIKIMYKNDMSVESDIEDNIHISLYRIAQESINNAIKHSKATELKVSMSEFDDHVGFFISDNGVGFKMDQATSGNGIKNMRERVKIVNGTIDIHSSRRGTTIEVEIPTK
ncbi:MAG: histidine kinase [Ekhidna sp.]|uniref:sensor histidine kinase n=1 Tax=Ekhidna sp. TaxID=2608089 RepID=UPI0032ECDC30